MYGFPVLMLVWIIEVVLKLSLLFTWDTRGQLRRNQVSPWFGSAAY